MGKNSVVIVAAGKGKRMGLDMNKQYVEAWYNDICNDYTRV